MMDWEEALKIVVQRTGHERYRELCSDLHPDHDSWRSRMIDKVDGRDNAYPPLATQARNAIGAIGRVIAAAVHGEPILVGKEEVERRLAICRACDLYDATQHRCRRCACYTSLKLELATERCPLNKWAQVTSDPAASE